LHKPPRKASSFALIVFVDFVASIAGSVASITVAAPLGRSHPRGNNLGAATDLRLFISALLDVIKVSK
jgi:hypothetical protein